jgi:hypothetical protein
MHEPLNEADFLADERTIPTINSRLPMGDDIAKLLLLCAPPDTLKEFDLSEENKGEFAIIFNSLDEFCKIQMFAMALFYANRNAVGFIKSHSIVRPLYISPEVIHYLVQLADVEAFTETKGMLAEIEKEKKSRAAGKGHVENRAMKNEAIQYYKDNHTKFKNKHDAASYIANNIMPIAYSTVRDWLKGVKPE